MDHSDKPYAKHDYMTIRAHIATEAMAAIIQRDAIEGNPSPPAVVADFAVEYADALLQRLAKKPR